MCELDEIALVELENLVLSLSLRYRALQYSGVEIGQSVAIDTVRNFVLTGSTIARERAYP
jgi:hypothetical protein